MSTTEVPTGPTSNSSCSLCGHALVADAAFCSRCGSAVAKPRNDSPRSEANENNQSSAQKTATERYGWMIWIIAFLMVCVLGVQGKFDQPLSWLVAKLGLSSPELSVEVNKLAMQQSSKFGFITITNLSNQPVTLNHVTINRNKSAGCSFDPKGATQLGSSNILEAGGHAMIGTPSMIAGLCGSFMIVEIDTDRGLAELSINWR